MKRILFILMSLFLFSLSQINAQKVTGQLDKETINDIKATFKNTPTDVALINAVTHNDIKKLSRVSC